MAELLRFTALGFALAEGEWMAVVGDGARDLALSLIGRINLARNEVMAGIYDLARVPAADRGFAYLGAQEELALRKSVMTHALAPKGSAPHWAAQALEQVGMIGLDEQPAMGLNRYDRQRLCLVKALVTRPRLLVLDDPLAELPPVSQMNFRRLLLKIHQSRPEMAMLLVSPRREDVLMLADRIAVLEEGRLAQAAPPRQVYEQPATVAVAQALGEVNLLDGQVASFDGEVAEVMLDGLGVAMEAMAPAACGVGMAGQIAIRPERVAIGAVSLADANAHALKAKFIDSAFLGDAVLLRFALANGLTIQVRRPSAAPLGNLAPGRMAALSWTAGSARFLLHNAGEGD